MTAPAHARTGSGRASGALRSVRGYQRSWLASDVLAAVTLLAIAVPEQLATSRLAGMPPVTGFYAFVAGTVLCAWLGANPRMSVGAGGVAAGLIGAFPVNASPARTAAVTAARGRTQVAGLLAAVGVAGVVPAAGLLRDVPLAALAGVLLYVATRIFHLRELTAIARFDRFEFALALITLLAVALIGVEQGIGVAVGLAILDRTRLTARPTVHVLGRIAGTTSWAPLSAPERPAEVPGVLVVLFAAPLWYANAAHFRAGLDKARRRSVPRPRLVVLDALGMYDVDFTGARALSEVLDALRQEGTAFAVARAGDHLKQNLDRGGLLRHIGADHFYPSVDEAVRSAAATPRPGRA